DHARRKACPQCLHKCKTSPTRDAVHGGPAARVGAPPPAAIRRSKSTASRAKCRSPGAPRKSAENRLAPIEPHGEPRDGRADREAARGREQREPQAERLLLQVARDQ